MGRHVVVAFYVMVMIAVIVGVDFAFLRTRFWERLTINVGIVLIFVVLYLIFLKYP